MNNKIELFWQYPVITEKKFYEQEKHNKNYIGLPWATIIDKKYNIQIIDRYLYNIIVKKKNHNYYTCCQHISFRKLIPLWKKYKITIIYTPHKIIGENTIDGIEIRPCPLYAVNIEDPTKNISLQNIDFLENKRNILYSFIGSYSKHYISDIRKKIFQLPKKKDVYIVDRGNEWHFDPIVYSVKQNKDNEYNGSTKHTDNTYEYNTLLLQSRYTLCPSGTGPNSIRFWEALGSGSIPILLADTLDLPKHPLWDKTIIRIPEKDIHTIDIILQKISIEEEKKRRSNCLIIYEYFKNNYTNKITQKEIIHYCCGSYDLGNYGGVARYDYHIKLAFPERVFFMGPQEKSKMLEYLKKCKNPLIITDNHLSCDIPNKYNTLLVHHGCAKTTADRNPDWDAYWKDLCCNGQNRMLSYRDPKTTTILSISKSCTDDFTKYYGKDYTKFKRIDVLHTSELEESRYKTSWNDKPKVLGNWAHVKKGKTLMPQIKKMINGFTFQQLKVGLTKTGPVDFNKRKQDIYLKHDIFLQLSNSEGNSYASLDALLCGLVVVSSNVGLFYEDVPEDCFVKLDWKRNHDTAYVLEKLQYAWEHKEEISKKGREWYMKNCRFVNWKRKMNHIINDKVTDNILNN